MRKLIACLLLALPRPVFAQGSSGHWTEVRSPNFTVLTDGSANDGRKVAAQFERMRAVFHVLMPTAKDDSGAPIVVLALRDAKDFRAVEPPAYLEKNSGQLDGYFMRSPDRNYVLLRLNAEGDHPYATVYHEYTHYMMRKADWMPLWLDEGLAEFYQNATIHEKDVMLGEPSANDIGYLRENRLIPLATLLKVDHSSPYYHEQQKMWGFYAESWALTHYLELRDAEQGTDQLRTYAKLLIQHVDSVDAAQQAFGDLKKLEAAVFQYVQRQMFGAFRMRNPPMAGDLGLEAQPISTAEADAVRADVLLDVGRQKEAEALLAAVLQADPKNAQAHETMGAIRMRAHDMDGAKKWYGEAVDLDSKSYLANYLFASTMLESGDRTRDEAIEKSLLAAIELNPKYAPSYDALARYYASRHEKLEEAHRLNLMAVSLEPEVLGYRLNTANVLMEGKHYDDAVRVLKMAEHLAKGPEETESVESRIYQIERYKASVEEAQGTRAARAETTVTTNASSPVRPAPVVEDVVYPEKAGARHTASGVVHEVKCSYPTVLTLTLDRTDKPLTLYTNNYFKVVFTTGANYNPTGELLPCTGIEGLKAKVEYGDVEDKRVAGQIVSMELSK